MATIKIVWSRLIPLTKDKIQALEDVSGVYRLSKKADDNKYYVFFVGSAENIKKRLLQHLLEDEPNLRLKLYLSQGGEFSFRYAVVEDSNVQAAIEKQMYKHYIPEFNSEEPKSTLDIEANLI